MVSTSRNAIVILAGSVIAAILTNPQGDYPFYLTGYIRVAVKPSNFRSGTSVFTDYFLVS